MKAIIQYIANNSNTVLPHIMAWAFIFFQQLFTPATKQDRQLYETSIYYLKFWIKVFEWWIIIAACDAHVADSLDTVHHSMDRVRFTVIMYTNLCGRQ